MGPGAAAREDHFGASCVATEGVEWLGSVGRPSVCIGNWSVVQSTPQRRSAVRPLPGSRRRAGARRVAGALPPPAVQFHLAAPGRSRAGRGTPAGDLSPGRAPCGPIRGQEPLLDVAVHHRAEPVHRHLTQAGLSAAPFARCSFEGARWKRGRGDVGRPGCRRGAGRGASGRFGTAAGGHRGSRRGPASRSTRGLLDARGAGNALQGDCSGGRCLREHGQEPYALCAGAATFGVGRLRGGGQEARGVRWPLDARASSGVGG